VETSAKAKISRGKVFHVGTYHLLVWPWNMLQGHRDGATGQSTHDFLLVLYVTLAVFLVIFCATVDFMPKWPCWVTDL